MTIVDAIRRKYSTFLPKARDVVSPDGEVISSLDERGAEVLDDTPIAPPVGYVKQPSMSDYIRDLIRSEKLAQEAAAAGLETFEESEDFDVDDDYDPTTPYEAEFDPEFLEAKERLIQEHSNVKPGGGQPPVVAEPGQGDAKSAKADPQSEAD
nr:MAG: hypothetical protein [Microvirus sp.]